MRRLTQLARRRTQVISQIANSRRELNANLSAARKDVALAGLGFLAQRFLAKHPILRTLAIAAFVLSTRSTLLSQLGLKNFLSGEKPK
jgi:hypothetical protein